MAFKLEGKQTELLLNFREYIDTWTSLITEYHHRGVGDDDIFGALQLDDEQALRFSMEWGTVVLTLAMRTWNQKRLKEDIQKKVEQAVVEQVYATIFAGDDPETLAACKEFYKAHYDMLVQLAPGKSKKIDELRNELIGFARYAVAQCSSRPEEENAQAIEKLSLLLISAMVPFRNLTENTIHDTTSVLGKPRFIVRKKV